MFSIPLLLAHMMRHFIIITFRISSCPTYFEIFELMKLLHARVDLCWFWRKSLGTKSCLFKERVPPFVGYCIFAGDRLGQIWQLLCFFVVFMILHFFLFSLLVLIASNCSFSKFSAHVSLYVLFLRWQASLACQLMYFLSVSCWFSMAVDCTLALSLLIRNFLENRVAFDLLCVVRGLPCWFLLLDDFLATDLLPGRSARPLFLDRGDLAVADWPGPPAPLDGSKLPWQPWDFCSRVTVTMALPWQPGYFLLTGDGCHGNHEIFCPMGVVATVPWHFFAPWVVATVNMATRRFCSVFLAAKYQYEIIF